MNKNWKETQTCSIKQAQSVGLASDHYSNSIVIKHLQHTGRTDGEPRHYLPFKFLETRLKLTVGTYSEGNLFVV